MAAVRESPGKTFRRKGGFRLLAALWATASYVANAAGGPVQAPDASRDERVAFLCACVRGPRDMVIVREEQLRDRSQVRFVNEAAFGRADEADLVDGLFAEAAVLLSLVAELDGQIIGHILFSRMTVETEQGPVAAVSLAPMAVLPDRQSRGVGSELIRSGLALLRDRGERIVIVLGHEHYYPRFGFSSAKARDLTSPFPPEAFMALELSKGALTAVRGAVRYASAFGLPI